jgi:hypothetical protein
MKPVCRQYNPGIAVAAQKPVNADSPVKSAGNEENHEVQEGDGRK